MALPQERHLPLSLLDTAPRCAINAWHMAATYQKPRSPFGNLLREALDETGVSVKELSRRIAGEPHQAEAKRQSALS